MILFPVRVLWGLGAGALLAAAFPPWNLPYLLPLGVALLLFLLRDVSSLRQAAYIGLACGAVYMGGTLFWLGNLFGAAAVSLCAIAAAFPTLYAVLFVWLKGRLPGVPPWLLAALTWTGIEYFRSEPFWLNFGWGGLGYAVVRFPLLAAFAAGLGSYGLTFVLVVFGAVLARGERRAAALLVAIWLIVCLVPRPVPEPRRPLAVRLVQAFPDDTDSLFQLSTGPPVDVVLWPEYSLLGDPTRDPALWKRLQGVARDNHCYFIFGAKDQFAARDEAAFRNTAYVLAPDGRLIGRHVKNHTVHFIRDGVPGTEARAIPTTLGPLGVAICFDMDYPDVARRLAGDGAEVFLVPNMDPAEWGPVQREQHRLLFQMRAAECGRWLARADVAGGTSVVAPTGRETARVSTAEPVALDVRVGREAGKTIYVRGGWRFGPACLAALVLLCLVAAFYRGRGTER